MMPSDLSGQLHTQSRGCLTTVLWAADFQENSSRKTQSLLLR